MSSIQVMLKNMKHQGRLSNKDYDALLMKLDKKAMPEEFRRIKSSYSRL